MNDLLPVTIDIYMKRCHMSLKLPIFFEMAYLDGIRDVFKLMTVEPWRNDEAREKLRLFFPEWRQDLNARLERETETLKADEQKARTAESQVACFGTMATKEMKATLKTAKGDAKRTAQRVKRAKGSARTVARIARSSHPPSSCS
ncbi:hypothetical protein FACS1894208_10380 [Clostridia bacterium]|nr:hypothetical protein FACS1894208_10380 [Clostridia bacterium]